MQRGQDQRKGDDKRMDICDSDSSDEEGNFKGQGGAGGRKQVIAAAAVIPTTVGTMHVEGSEEERKGEGDRWGRKKRERQKIRKYCLCVDIYFFYIAHKEVVCEC